MFNSGNQSLPSGLSEQIQANMLGRTLSGIVRSELATIEAALQHGVRYEQLCQHLAALGIKVSAATLRQTVYRLRRKQGRPMAVDSASTSGNTPASVIAHPLPIHHVATSASPTPETPRLTAPQVAACPPRAVPVDTVPLLSGSPASPAGSGARVDFISQIRGSFPDLDLLADRYRKSLRSAGQSESAAGSKDPTRKPSADLTSTPSPTANPSS